MGFNYKKQSLEMSTTGNRNPPSIKGAEEDSGSEQDYWPSQTNSLYVNVLNK
jgi:hypothetical protein